MKTGSNNGEVTCVNVFDENMLSVTEKVGDEKNGTEWFERSGSVVGVVGLIQMICQVRSFLME